jgi:ribosomal protein S18 acetylase RimI-like enzyme
MQLTSRPSRAEDQDFLFRLYASTRSAEIAAFGWNDLQKQAFLSVQFKAQQRWYETAYPQAEQRIVMIEDRPIGRTIVHRGADAVVLVDISLLPESRGQGWGTQILRELFEQCRRDAVPLRLQVLRTNPAQRLYARLGFQRTGEDPLYLQMEWRSGEASSANG